MADDQSKLQTLSSQLQKIQDDLQNHLTALQTLQSQQSESGAVAREFSNLPPAAVDEDDGNSNTIYKLVGPVLLKQDRTEAVGAVEARLEYINKEVGRTEGRIKELQENGEKVRGEIVGLQVKMQGDGGEGEHGRGGGR